MVVVARTGITTCIPGIWFSIEECEGIAANHKRG
jgi:hypothetical protein